MIERGFKVCTALKEGLEPEAPLVFFSATTLGKVVKYRRGVQTERPAGCGPLMVFRNLESAVFFSNRMLNPVIFTCVYEVSRNTQIPEDLIRLSTSTNGDVAVVHGVWAGLTWDSVSISESVVDFADSVTIGVPVWSDRERPGLTIYPNWREESLQIPLFP